MSKRTEKLNEPLERESNSEIKIENGSQVKGYGVENSACEFIVYKLYSSWHYKQHFLQRKSSKNKHITKKTQNSSGIIVKCNTLETDLFYGLNGILTGKDPQLAIFKYHFLL